MKKALASLMAFMLVIVSVLGISHTVLATGFTGKSGGRVVISESVDGSLAVSGDDVIIKGDVNGALFAAGRTITIKGNVSGPIFTAGETVNFEGNSEGDVFVAGNTVTTGENAKLGRDLFAAVNQINIDGSIGRDIFIGSNATNIKSNVGRDARISSNKLDFTENGQVEGDLFYQSNQRAENVDEYVQGEVHFQQTVQRFDEDVNSNRDIYQKILKVVGVILSAILIWLFLRGISQGSWITISEELVNRPIILMFVGLGILILMVIVSVLLLISRIFTNIGIFIILIFLMLLFLGKIVAASAIAKYIVEPRLSLDKNNELSSFSIAYIILYILSILPAIGWVSSLLSVVYTVGLAFREMMIRFRRKTA